VFISWQSPTSQVCDEEDDNQDQKPNELTTEAQQHERRIDDVDDEYNMYIHTI